MNDMTPIANQYDAIEEHELLQLMVKRLEAAGAELGVHIFDVAKMWGSLKSRGSSLCHLVQKTAERFCFDEVNAGRLDPAIPARMAAYSSAVRLISRLEMDEQRKLAQMPFVKIAKLSKDGIEIVDVPVDGLTRSECSMLIDEKLGRMRSPEEQMTFVKPKRATQTRRSVQWMKYRLTDDEVEKFRLALARFNKQQSLHLSPEGMVQRLVKEFSR